MGKFGTIAVIKRKSRTVFLLGKSTTQIFLLTDKEKRPASDSRVFKERLRNY